MNSKLEQIYLGQRAVVKKSFSHADVIRFAKLSGDVNPIHLDETFAAQSYFKKRIVHGFLYASLISTVLGTILPGPGTIYLHQELNFKNPVFLDEEVTAIVEVTEINYEKSLVYLATYCFKGEDSVIVVDGNAIVKLIE